MTQLSRFLVLVFYWLATCTYAADESPLHQAAREGDKAKVAALLARGADVNAKNPDEAFPWNGWTPLHAAVYRGKKDVAELLLAKGADVNADVRGAIGGTPLHFAAESGNIDVAKLLLAHGADANARNRVINAFAGVVGYTPTESAYKISENEASIHGYQLPLGVAEHKRVMVALLKKAAVAAWQKSAGGNPRQALQKLVEQLKKSGGNETLREAIFDLESKLRPHPVTPPEAEELEGRALYAFKNAKSEAEILAAARDYLKAMDLAPWVPGYYHDLCWILERANRPSEALRACEFYLVAAPNAEDASAVRVRIGGLKKKMEGGEYPLEVMRRRGMNDGLGWLATQGMYR